MELDATPDPRTDGKVQQIVLDVEDKFYTLREKYDYVLAGRHGGDCVTSEALADERVNLFIQRTEALWQESWSAVQDCEPPA